MTDGDVELTVYYDGACPLCTIEIDYYRGCRGAGAIQFVDVAGSAASLSGQADLGPGLTCDGALRRFHVRDRNGDLLSGAEAFARLWQVLPRWRWLGRVAGSRMVLPVAEAAYRAFLPVRPYLARAFAWAGARARS
jgi:predicted DCC family thiol-disulfide oxidoreductase YuxK